MTDAKVVFAFVIITCFTCSVNVFFNSKELEVESAESTRIGFVVHYFSHVKVLSGYRYGRIATFLS